MCRQSSLPRTVLLLVVLAVVAGGQSGVRADFKMWQNLNTGRVSSGNRVECNDANGFVHWNTRSVSVYHNTASQGSGKATALKNAMASWTNVPDAAHVLSYAGTTSAGFATDGINTVVWGTNGGCTGSCAALAAVVLQSGQVIVESDVLFNNGLTWTTDGSTYDTESVAAHELGHLLGIHHPNTVSGPQTMSAPYFGTAMRSLHADDIAALQCSENRYCPPGATPAPPLSLTVYNGSCYGHNDVIWTTSCEGTTRYELYRSTSSSFTSQTLEYSGLDLSKHVVVSGTTYFRIRACNANGCGGYRVADAPATYYPGCP